MIDSIINLSIRFRWFVVLLTIVLALAGGYAARHTPVDAIPDLSENQVIVYTPWPGHSPTEIEKHITSHLSTHLQGIEGVLTVRGSSELDFSSITVVFTDFVGVATARSRVEARLAQVKGLPEGTRAALAPEAPATGQIFWYVLVAPKMDLARQRQLQDTVVGPQLAIVPGVAEVASVGGFLPEFQIEIEPQKAKSHNVSTSKLTAALNSFEFSRADNASQDHEQALGQLRGVELSTDAGKVVPLSSIATVAMGPLPRRGVLEMDGVELVGGVVMMRYGANPLEVTDRLERRLEQIEKNLPQGVTLLTVYDRVRLIHTALGVVSTTMLEAIVTASLCVVVVLLHFRTSLVISLTLPLTVLGSFLMLYCLRAVGFMEARTNIMSLAGLVISIGVLVDSSVVIAENVVHALRARFGDQPVQGDVRQFVSQACRGVGRPVFFSVLIMLLSFAPVLALSGLEGKMFRPLAFAKCFALIAAAILAITVVPALCTFFVRGRMRKEEDSWLVRSTFQVYRPILTYLLDRPASLAVLIGVTLIVGFAPLGIPELSKAVLGIALLCAGLTSQSWWSRSTAWTALILVALVVQPIQPLQWERIPPLDEGTAMDMPITLPGISVSQATDDLKMRDMVLCRFPEVEMVMGKVGRAETATDPAPVDMIETMVMFRPYEFWPKRHLTQVDALRYAQAASDELVSRGVIDRDDAMAAVIEQVVDEVLPRFDAQLREYCYQRNKTHSQEVAQFLRLYLATQFVDRLAAAGLLLRTSKPSDIVKLADPEHHHAAGTHTPTWRDLRRNLRALEGHARQLDLIPADAEVLARPPGSLAGALNIARTLLGEERQTLMTVLASDVLQEHDRLWKQHTLQLNRELEQRAAGVYTRQILVELLSRVPPRSDEILAHLSDLQKLQTADPSASGGAGHHHGASSPNVRRSYELDAIHRDLTQRFLASLLLQVNDRQELGGFGGEMDTALQMPGWTNVWTRPIQNRVDMLSTGVNTDIGICVLGNDQQSVVAASQQVAEVINKVPGASGVVADPIRGKQYLKVIVDPEKLADRKISQAEWQSTLEMATGGRIVAHLPMGSQRVGVRVHTAAGSAPEEVRRIPVIANSSDVTIGDVAEVKYEEGATSIKSENGLLRNYVRLNVRGRDPQKFIDEAKQTLAAQLKLPPEMTLTWTGQFEHQQQSQRALAVLMPIVLVLIFGILVWTYRDFADALLVMLALPGALAGGLFMQWLCGTKLSVTVLVGYIACFGMAASTGVIMLVYLRDAVKQSGGLAAMTLEQLRAAVLTGAVHRLRPKLLTELTTVIGLAPMLWATGIGSEVIRPMAAPVLGGILVADEIVDLFLPVAFYWVRKQRWRRLQQSQPQPIVFRNETESV